MRGWMSESDVHALTDRKMDELVQRVREIESRPPLTTDNELVARAHLEARDACEQIREECFFAAIGVQDVLDGGRETFFLSKAPDAYVFNTLNIVPWTNWLGQLYVQVREAAEAGGKLPRTRTYGPPARLQMREMGPIVDYRVREGAPIPMRIILDSVRPIDAVRVAAAATESPPTGAVESLQLGEIIQTIDLAQDSEIRGPMSGMFVLTGGPGTGKTTVAIHRLPYLINEQQAVIPVETPKLAIHVEGRKRFFDQESSLVLVWKAHLVPYLKGLLKDLHLARVRVQTVDAWVQDCLNSYGVIGPDKLRIGPAPIEFEHVKMSISSDTLSQFLRNNTIRAEAMTSIREKVDVLERRMVAARKPVRLPRPTDTFDFTVAGLDSFLGLLRSQARDAASGNDALRTEIRTSIDALRKAEIARLTNYGRWLTSYLTSTYVIEELTRLHGTEFAVKFREFSVRLGEQKLITHADRHLLLWLIHRLTRGGDGDSRATRPLPTFSHVIIDEAQYYSPMLLQLVTDLLRAPFKSMTIVGDLEQKVSRSAGLVQWADVGLALSPERIRRLETNYRWAREVFQFLSTYAASTGIAAALHSPRRWMSGDGLRPRVLSFVDRADEHEYLARRISALRDTEGCRKWTLAVVVPSSLLERSANLLVDALDAYGTSARVARGADVAQSIEDVVITDPENIVGLEFDVVFVTGFDAMEAVVGAGDPAAWVSLTRARRLVEITYCGSVPLLERPPMSAYRAEPD